MSLQKSSDEFAFKGGVAILPRGFDLGYLNQGKVFPYACFDCPVDNHVLQMAYNLGHEERFIEQGKNYYGSDPVLPSDASYVDLGFVSWETHWILKDDSLREDTGISEEFSALGGDDVGTIKPPFTILPKEDVGPFTGCINGGEIIKTDEYVIENVPYEYAVPLLTGWDISEGCNDKDVKEIGVWLHDIEYEKAPSASAGTLRYQVSSVFRDDDGPSHSRRQNVSILGIRLTERETPLREIADIISVPDATGDFCNRNDSGQLVVTVRNQGNKEAPASTTTVRFFLTGSSPSFDMTTPPLGKNEAVDLDFDIPAGCFNADCDFEITVDSKEQVDELNEENNVVDGICFG